MRSLLLTVIGVLAVPSSAQTARPLAELDFGSLPALETRMKVPTTDELVDELRGADRTRQAAILEELPSRTAAADSAAQRRLVWALRDLADSQQAAPEVRGRALLALGRCGTWMRDLTAEAEGIRVLMEEAGRDDMNRLPLQVYALEGIVEATHRLPSNDSRLIEDLASTLLDTLRRGRPQQERVLALRALSRTMSSSGIRVADLWTRLGARFDDEILRPVESDAIYDDADKWPLEARYHALVIIDRLGWLSQDLGARERAKGALRRMSERDPDARLRQTARAAAERMHA